MIEKERREVYLEDVQMLGYHSNYFKGNNEGTKFLEFFQRVQSISAHSASIDSCARYLESV